MTGIGHFIHGLIGAVHPDSFRLPYVVLAVQIFVDAECALFIVVRFRR